MNIWNLPQLFQGYQNRLVSELGMEAVLYQAHRETQKANSQFMQNAVVFLVNGYKEIITNTQKISLQSGEGFFIRKGNYLITEKPVNNATYESLLFFFPDEVARHYVAALPPQKYTPVTAPEVVKVPASEYLLPFIQSVKPFFNTKLGQQDLNRFLDIKAQELFWLLTHSGVEKEFQQFLTQLQKPHAATIETLVQKHFRENISLEQLAFLGGYSLSTFKRRFEEIYQTTPHKWIQEKRLQEAHFLLQSTDKNVSEVCLEVGFENLSHFIQAFKEKFGHTPKQFQVSC